jgi:dTDP-4-amino-4,6-dideoxygalactose transaminase
MNAQERNMFSIPINDLSRSTAKSEEAAAAIISVLRSGFWIHGPEHKAFEGELADFLGAEHLLGVASGTDALEIALRAVGCIKGSKVISVANAGGYTSIAAANIGCEIIYCDINPITLQMDQYSLEQLISSRISAVVVTHLYGNVAPVRAIKTMCADFGIAVIEDCAQAIGAFDGTLRIGTIGDIGAFSFYPTKNLGGIGDGGALATNNQALAEKILQLRQYGWLSKYEIFFPGGKNSRLDEIQAAILRIGLRNLDSLNDKRRSIVSMYSEALKGSKIQMVTSSEIGSAAHLGVLLLPDNIKRDIFRSYMHEKGIQTDIHYPILDFDQFGLFQKNSRPNLPISIRLSDQIVTIPLFPELTTEEIGQVCVALKSFSNF